MSQLIQIKCDECRKIKNESNHWFKIETGPMRFVVYKKVAPDSNIDEKSIDACGVECVIKMLSKWSG